MIEDKKKGTMFAESENEAAWWRTSEDISQGIQMHKMRINRAEADLKIPDRKLIQKFRDGAKAVIKQTKEVIAVQEELLKFAQSKIKNSEQRLKPLSKA